MLNLQKSALLVSVACSFLAAAPGQSQGILNIDVSGRAGTSAQSGTDYSQSGQAPLGQDGLPGGHGGFAGNGGDGGSFDLTVSSSPQAGVFVLTGSAGPQRVNGTYPLNTAGYIYVTANGGAGGSGGDAGAGQQGGQGLPGLNAVAPDTAATDGQKGMTGGVAGNPSSGGYGGRGGIGVIRLKESDSHLLMLVKTSNQGGLGGPAGHYANQAPGGPGGIGGEGTSWEEQVPTGTTHTEQVIDSNGQPEFTVTETPIMVQATDGDGTPLTNDDGSPQMVQATNDDGSLSFTEDRQPIMQDVPDMTSQTMTLSAGADGPAGDFGPQSPAIVTDGQPGPNGPFTIFVTHGDGTTTAYTSRYDLQVLSYSLQGDTKNTFYEPGEGVTVSNIMIKNTGGMPSPVGDAIFNLQNGAWIVAQSIGVKLPSVILPGQTITITQPLKFKIQDTNITNAGPRMNVMGTIVPAILMTGANRFFENTQGVDNVEVTFPVEVTQVATAQKAYPGDTVKLLFNIKNISNEDFGSGSSLKRQLVANLRAADGSTVDLSHVSFIDPTGKEIPLSQGLPIPIPLLKAGEIQQIQGLFRIAANAPVKGQLNMGLDLTISHVADPTNMNMRTVQIQNFGTLVQATKTWIGNAISKVSGEAQDRAQFIMTSDQKLCVGPLNKI